MAQIHFTANLNRHVDCPTQTLPADTVQDLFSRYFEQHPGVRGFVLDDQGHVRKHVKVIVDGRNMRDRNKLSDPLRSDSEVFVFQALSGG